MMHWGLMKQNNSYTPIIYNIITFNFVFAVYLCVSVGVFFIIIVFSKLKSGGSNWSK